MVPCTRPVVGRSTRRRTDTSYTRRAWKRALDDPRVETLHEWRKRAKDLRYVMELLELMWPEMIHPRAGEVERLESDLGEDHDLAMLPAHVIADSVCPNEHDRDVVIALVDVPSPRASDTRAKNRRPGLPGAAARDRRATGNLLEGVAA